LANFISNGADRLAVGGGVGVNPAIRGIRNTSFVSGFRMHSARRRIAARQHAIAYSADGLHDSMLALTAPGDGDVALQSTDPVGSVLS
jgi:hypothetical protein